MTLYGQVKAGVEISQVKVKDTDTNGEVVKTKTKTATEIADYGSRIGFKGHEHLGSNLNALKILIVQFQMFLVLLYKD